MERSLKYITYSELLCSKLALVGFKRKKYYEFVRKHNSFIQTITFCHSALVSHFRDYYIIAGLYYPELEKMAMNLDVYTAGAWGMNIGYLTPQKHFKEWRVKKSASEDDVREVVIDMTNYIGRYAVTFLNKYSDINELIFELGVGNLIIPHHADYNLPLLYVMTGEKEQAISYLYRELERKEMIVKKSKRDCPVEAQNDNSSFISPVEKEYNEYKEFADKLLKRIGQ